MEHQGDNVFKKPEEPRPKTPTPYEEASFLGEMVALHDARAILSTEMCFDGEVTFWYQLHITSPSIWW